MSSESFQCDPPEDDRIILDLDDWKFQLNGEAVTSNPPVFISASQLLPTISPNVPPNEATLTSHPSDFTSASPKLPTTLPYVPQAWIPNQKFLSNSAFCNQPKAWSYQILPATSISPEEPQQMISQRSSSMLDWHFEPEKVESHNTRNIEKNSFGCMCPNCKEGGINRNKATTSHQRIHSCHIKNCSKTYTRTSHLRAHIRSHTGERPYLCPVMNCGKNFVRSDDLLRHERIHTGEKRHLCKTCGKGFSRLDHLKKHEISHIPKWRKPGKKTSSVTNSDKLNVTSTAMIDCQQHKQLQVNDYNRQLPMQEQQPKSIKISVPDAAQPNTFVEIIIPEMNFDSFENLTPTPQEQQHHPLDYSSNRF